MPDATCVYVVPCFDEEKRIDRRRFLDLARDPHVRLLFVDDGSRDRTGDVIEELAAASPLGEAPATWHKIEALRLPRNVGKAEAVRVGMLHALERGATKVGFTDADLSTPPYELIRLATLLDGTMDLDVVIGSRVLMVGRRIDRRPMRHYSGRVFATLAANILRTPFYDTQCGAKLFRAVPTVRAALATPFRSRWAFDVELLGRLLVGVDGTPAVPIERIREVPLEEWVDEPGSKLKFTAMAKTLVDLLQIEIDLRRLRRPRP